MSDFVHLHVHTQYSLLDGAIKIKKLMKKVNEHGMTAVAMTDHGNMYGAVDFQKAAKKNGLKSIIGCELYVTKEPYDLEEKVDPRSYHLTMLARDHTGYKNLMFLNSMAWLKGVHPRSGVARVDFDLIAAHNEGIIALSGDLGGEINQAILKGDEDEARELAIKYRDAFPKDHFYLEVMRNALPEQERCNEVLFRFSEELGIPLVATNDCHYLEQKDARAHAVLMCIQLGKSVDLERIMDHGLDQLYVRSAEEMYEAFSDHPEACENTVKIAQMCDLEIPLGNVYLPKYGVPEEFEVREGFEIPDKLAKKYEDAGVEFTEQDRRIHAFFEHVSLEGLDMRFAEFDAKGVVYDRQEYVDRLNVEIGIIREMDFPGYFLIVWDFINWSKENGIPVGPGRGSGAGSLVAYALTITNIDPLPYDLLFERFLNPERVSMPDFDIDFCMNRRGEVIEYVTQKYGHHNVGQIITYGQLKAKAVVRDVGRALGLKYGETDRLAKLVPDVLGITLQEALDQEPRLTQLRHEDERVDALFDIALSLENLNRQAGMHAAGVVISETPLWDFVPICRGANDELVTQFAKNEVEEAGLVKFDFLGLKTLTVIETALKLINDQRAAGEEPFDIEKIPMDDRRVFKMISAGDTTGVFQLESSGFQELLKKLKPDCFEDIVAAVALYRPGPLGTGMVDDFIDRKHGRKKVEYPHPWLEPVLKPTYGVMVYQEQVMQTARTMAGYSLGGADILRRCVTGDTLVTCAETGRRIRVDQMQEGTIIHSVDTDHLELVEVPVLERIENGTREVVELRTRSGRTIKLTEDHPVLTVSGWRHLCDLQVGDAIAVPTHLSTHAHHSVSEERVKVLAYLIGDGQTLAANGRATARFYNKDAELVQDYIDQIQKLGAHHKTYQDKRSVTTVTCRAPGRGQINPVVALVKECDIAKRAEHKRLPEEIFSYDENTLAMFLGTLWSTDGSVEKTCLSYGSSSEALTRDVAHTLLRFGIVTVPREKKTYRLPHYELLISDQRDIARFHDVLGSHLCSKKAERLEVLMTRVKEKCRNQSIYNIPAEVTHLVAEAKYRSGRTWTKAGEAAGIDSNYLSSGLNFKEPKRALSRHRLHALAQGFDSDRLKRIAEADLLWDPITSIEPLGPCKVYDLSVPPWANFIANDIVVHNSMGKKKKEVMDQQKGIFVEGATGLGVPEEKSSEIFDLMAYFAGYGFNKSHSAAYALITYQTGFLKAHYKVEFMAALMTNDRDNTDKVVRFINEAKDMKIEVLPPDVNESALDFSVTDGKIRFGLAAIKGVGAAVIESVIEARATGPFKSLYDFCARVDLKKINKRTIEAFVKCGAFDSVGPHAGSSYIGDHCVARARMLAAIPLAVDRGQQAQHDAAVGQSSLFGMLAPAQKSEALKETYPDAAPWTDRELLQNERGLIGFYVTGHPLDRFQDEIALYGVTSSSDITYCRGLRPRDEVTIAGVVSEYRERPLKSGNGRMAFLMMEDKSGQCEVLVFSSAFAANEEALKCNEPILIKGQYTEDGDMEARVGKLRANEVTRLLDARKRYVKKVSIEIDVTDVTNGELGKVRKVLDANKGDCKTHLTLNVPHEYGKGRTELVLPQELWVEPTDELLTDLERIFRRKVVKLSSS